MPAAPYLRPMFKGRKGIGALRKELSETRLLWQRQASWRKWVRLGLEDKRHGETGAYEHMEQGGVQPTSCDLLMGPG